MAELIVIHFEQYGNARSLGVIALSVAQEQAIDDEVLRIRAARPDLAPFFDETREEPFFVKNLEGVQGDERDHIIISVAYGHDENGVMSMNFGPINRAGGERRLNVAITRAKWQTVVVCSFLPLDLDLARLTTQNLGVVKLQRYLDYAYQGSIVEAAAPEGGTESDFEDAVERALADRGLKIDTQVGCSGFRIDLAVRHPDRQGRYILGIECDGAQYHSCRSARDRDRLRQEVLERQGWKMLRIWSLDWLRDKDKQVVRVLETVDELRHASDEGTLGNYPTSDPPLESVPKRASQPHGEAPNGAGVELEYPPIPELPPYVEYQPKRLGQAEELQQAGIWPAARDRAVAVLSAIVETEGPIHKRALGHRLAESYGIKRVGRQVQEGIDSVIRRAAAEGIISTKGDFVWLKGRKEVTPRKRPEGKEPPVEEIAVEEIAAAMVLVLEHQFGMPEDALITEAARLLGYHRTGQVVRLRFKQAVDHLAKTGAISKQGAQVILANREG